MAPADLDAALRLPVAHLPALPAALTYRLSHELGPVAWTTSPGAYGALRGSWAAFSPIEFVAAVEGGQGGAIGAATFAAWVSCKLADGEWRLDTRTARGGLPGRVECEKWWPGTDWCAGHWITPEHGWTVGLACAYFRLTPVSVELHAPPAQEAA